MQSERNVSDWSENEKVGVSLSGFSIYQFSKICVKFSILVGKIKYVVKNDRNFLIRGTA